VYGWQPDILTDRVAALEACAADTMARGELKMSALQMPTQRPNPAQIFATIQGYQQSYVLKAAVDLGVFSAIARGNHTVSAIAKAIQASERGTRIVCDALTVLNMLEKKDSTYQLTPDTAVFLDEKSPAYLGKALDFLLHESQIEGFRRMADAVRRGGTPEEFSALAPEDPLWVEFARGMGPLMAPAAQAIAEVIKPRLAAAKAPARVLDIAAGHGLFGVTVAEQAPNAEIYAVDWSNVLQLASETANAHGVAGRYHTLPGSAFEVEYGTGFQAALVTNFLHHFNPETNVKLLRKVYECLAPGGEVVILEFVPEEDRVSPRIPAMFSAVMLNGTPAGDAYTFSELRKMCEDAGFSGPRLTRLDPMPQALVVARKPN